MPFQHFPKEIEIFKKCSDFGSDDTSVREIPKSEANLPSDGKVILLEIWKMNWGSAKATNHYGTSGFI